MLRISELKLPLSALPPQERRCADAPLETAADRLPTTHPVAALKVLCAQALGVSDSAIAELQVHKRSFDARKAELLAVYIVDVTLAEPALEAELLARHAGQPHIQATPDMRWHMPARAPADWPGHAHAHAQCPGPGPGQPRPVVVGLGPCGLFAALALAQMGLKPIVLERGPPVRQRTQDTWRLWRKQLLTPESNVQFGEGGAGLFSDGKLYSQIKDPRFLGRKVMQEFVDAGAPSEILYLAHPHIGTFKLVKVVEALREKIIALGGEIRFQQRVCGVRLAPLVAADSACPCATGQASAADTTWRLSGLVLQDQERGTSHELPCERVVLAIGHSARDTFALLHDAGVHLEAKPFSIGVRIEHPQSVIDHARWGRHAGHPMLGAADYKLVHHASNGRSVYSFCMCPGGTVVAATSEPGCVVTNGMSQYSRNERNANAALVVGIDPCDYPLDTEAWSAAFGPERGPRYAAQARALQSQGRAHPLAGVVLQRLLEHRAFAAGGCNYHAPGQLVGDFLAQRPSTHWKTVLPSYQPGVQPGDLSQVLPDYAVQALREALTAFGRKIKGYDMADAVMTGVETRTSSPLRIPRGDDCQSLNVRGLYPAGEGAGYAGGILSAAVDGIRVAEAVACHTLGLPAPPPDRGGRAALAYG